MYEVGLFLLAVSVVAYVVVWPVLYYFWDPKGLRRYEGFTPLAGITDLAYCWLSDTGHRSRSMYEAHKAKGTILRIGPNALSFGNIAAIKDIYGHGTKCTKDVKETILGGTHTHLFDSIDKAEHARKRKVLSAAFAIKSLENWEFKVADVVGTTIRVFDQHCTKPLKSSAESPDPADLTLDYNKYINLFTIEAINKIALSSDLGMIERGTDEVTAERLDGSRYRAHYRRSQNHNARAKSTFVWSYTHYKLISWLSKFVPKYRQIWKESEPWGDIVYHQAAARLRRYQGGEKLDDFFSSLMDDKEGTPNNLELGEIVAESAAIIDAGAETTAIALTQIMDLLIRHPQHMKTLTAELDAVLDDDEVVAPYDKIKDLPFLRASLDEGMRLIPPTSMALPRRTPPEGAQILDEWIPGNTTVGMTIYGAHRDPSIFPDPETFQPHRWLNPVERKRMEPYFIPFSAGSRGCIGRNISYLEQAMMLASLVHRYRFAVSPSWQLPRHEAFNLLVGEMPVKIWKRIPSELGDDGITG
jgi:cytochrome P450